MSREGRIGSSPIRATSFNLHMRSKEEMIDLYESMYVDNMLWFVLGGLVSSDTFAPYMYNDNKKLFSTYRENIHQLENLITYLPESNIPNKEKKKAIKLAKSGIKILKNEHNNIIDSKEKRGEILHGEFEKF